MIIYFFIMIIKYYYYYYYYYYYKSMVKYYVSHPEKDFGWSNEMKQDHRDQSLVYSETVN